MRDFNRKNFTEEQLVTSLKVVNAYYKICTDNEMPATVEDLLLAIQDAMTVVRVTERMKKDQRFR